MLLIKDDRSSVVYTLTIGQNGLAQRWAWANRTQVGDVYTNMPTDICASYRLGSDYRMTPKQGLNEQALAS